MLILITGGTRSGKSRYAEALARHLAGDDVVYIASLQAKDEEMTHRILRHKSRRPEAWQTIEEPFEIAEHIPKVAKDKLIVLDCLSGLVSNHALNHENEGEEAVIKAMLAVGDKLVSAILTRPVIVVSNEVGAGLVPVYPLGRWYRDGLGLVNQRLARVADTVCLMTVGIPQVLKGHLPEVFFEA